MPRSWPGCAGAAACRIAVSCAAIAVIAALPATASAGPPVPASNLIANPSFSEGTSGWAGDGATVRRVRAAGAPDGRHVARVKRQAGAEGYSLDDSPDTVRQSGTSSVTAAGQVFVATAWARATSSTRGVELTIQITETSPVGDPVDSSESTVVLTKRYVELRVTHTAVAAGNSIGVRVFRSGEMRSGKGKDQFLVDAISLTSEAPDPTSEPSGESSGGSSGSGTGGTGTTGGTGGTGGSGGDGTEDPVIPPPPPPPPSTVPNTTSQIALTFSHEEQLVADAGSRYRYAVMRDFQHDKVGAFKAANPGSDLLVYKNAAFTVHDPDCGDAPHQASGLGWCDADAHESWFLHDRQTGQRLISSGYSYHYAMNVADPGFRQAWTESVLERLRETGYSGVFIDDVVLYPVHWSPGRVAEMSDGQYRDAMRDFIVYVGQRLRQEGYLVMPNVSIQSDDSAQRAAMLEIAHNVDVVNREYFVRWESGSALFTGNDWKLHLSLMEELLATGAGYNGMVYGSADDVQAQRYARATFLLGWDGEDGSSLMFRPDESIDAYLPDWTTDVGVPSGPRTAVGVGWKREFSDGIVVINPSASSSQGFSLGGSYRQPGGECTQSVELEPVQALVLSRC
jgi:Hypothetical glycosyl hydrolase family 15